LLHEKYQQRILPFRDSNQAALYFATLYASEYLKMQKNKDVVGASYDQWYPSVVEIGRGGPFSLKTKHPAGAFDPGESGLKKPPAKTHSPLAEIAPGSREAWQCWLVPLMAFALVGITMLTQDGRLALRHCSAAFLAVRNYLSPMVPRQKKRDERRRLVVRIRSDLGVWLLMLATVVFLLVAIFIPHIAQRVNQEPFVLTEGISSWPATWLRALGVFLCACYFWIVAWRFRHALANANRDLAFVVPICCPPEGRPPAPTPCQAWSDFRHRSRGGKMKVVVVSIWLTYVVLAYLLFKHLEIPADVTRGKLSAGVEQMVLIGAVFSVNLLIVYAVVHNISCSFFVRRVAAWLGSPDATARKHGPLHAALMRAIGHVAGVMTQMIYYPFTLLFLLIAARHSLFDNFDWPVLLVSVFSFSSAVLLASTLVLRRSCDRARKNAIAWVEGRIATLNWKSISAPHTIRERELQRARWQLDQINSVGGAALTEGFFSNPLLRAVLIPLGGTGLLQLMEVAGKFF
jgi:hypothetical protein